MRVLLPCERWHIILDVTIVTLTWWTWITYAPMELIPKPKPEAEPETIHDFELAFYRNMTKWGAIHVAPTYYSSIDTVQTALRNPASTFNEYVLMSFTAIISSWFFIYYLSRLLAHFSPLHYSSWVDWWFPPTDIIHTVQSENGKVTKTANEMKGLFSVSSFLLEKAYLALDNLHKYAARRRLAAVNMAQAISKRLGMVIHDEQMSRRAVKRGYNGTRTIVTGKDACSYVSGDLKYQKTDAGALVTHIDTFTHKDSRDANHTLSDGNIHFMYTWNPECVAGTSDEGSFRYDEDGNFIYEVEGSDPYSDRLWNFEDDCLVTYSYQLRCGFITTLSLLTAVIIFCYNVYINRMLNQDLYNFGPVYMKIFLFGVPYPVPNACTFTNYEGRIASFIHELSGLPVSWFSILEGYRYPCTAIHYRFIKYPWIVSANTLTNEHLLTILLLLALALAASYMPYAISHKVIRLDVGEHRSIVVVVPNCRFRGYAASFRPFLREKGLRPRIPITGVTDGGHKFIAEKRKKPSGYSVAFIDSSESRFVKDTAYDMTRSLTTDKSSPSISNVRQSCKSDGDDLHRTAVALAIALAKKHGAVQSYSNNYGFYPLPTIIRQDDESKADGNPIKEVMAHGAMPAIVSGGAYIHARSEAQTKDFVQRRLRDPAGRVDSTFTPEVVLYVNEFAEHIRRVVTGTTGYNHPIEPISEEEYLESRNKNQLNKLYDVMAVYDIHNYDDRMGFMKREVLSDPAKAARGICTYPPESQAIGGRISLAYAAAMKQCTWMGCGMNPVETQEAITRVCAGRSSATDTDFSAQDATIDNRKRNVELMLLLQLFDEKWHPVIETWHYTDYCGRVLYGDPGTKRESHEFNGSRGSGSPFTTLGNTPLTGLFAYIALRLSGLIPPEAWEGLGIYSGDDGVTAELPPAFCNQAAELLGFLVKSSINHKYVPFLGRHYFDPFSGHISSIQSPLRTLSKLHTTLLNIEEFTAEETMIMKAICLQVTDKDSDFFGAWSEKILKDAQKKQADSVQTLEAKILKYPGLHPYFAINALKSHSTFKNCPGDFEELFEEEMPGFDWCKFNTWLDSGDGPCPLLWEHPEPLDDELMSSKMEAVGPVTLAMGGVNDEANMIEYPSLPKMVGYKEKRKKEYKKKFSAELTTIPEGEAVGPDGETIADQCRRWVSLRAELPPRPKKNRARSPSEHREFLAKIKDLGLLDEYRAAKIVPTDSPDAVKEKRKTRDQITRKVAPVHKPRSQ